MKKAHLTVFLSGFLLSGITPAATVDSFFGINYTLQSDKVNYGDEDTPLYRLIVRADTTNFSKEGFSNENAFINTLTIQAKQKPISGSTTGPGGNWTNVLGGQNSNGCNSKGKTNFDCAYYTSGGNNPVEAPGVAMNLNNGTLEWVFNLGFSSGTTIDQALSFIENDSHIKADYYAYVIKKKGKREEKEYKFIGQTSEDITISKLIPPEGSTPPSGIPTIPEPGILSLFGIGLLGMSTLYARNIKRPKTIA